MKSVVVRNIKRAEADTVKRLGALAPRRSMKPMAEAG